MCPSQYGEYFIFLCYFVAGPPKNSKKAKNCVFVKIKNHEGTGRPGGFSPAQCTVSSREYGAPETIEGNHNAQQLRVIIFPIGIWRPVGPLAAF